VYPIGVPLLYYCLAKRNKVVPATRNKVLPDLPLDHRASIAEVENADDFISGAYTSRCWYWEVVESIRRLALSLILVFCLPGSWDQLVVGLAVNVLAIIFYSEWKPYRSESTDSLARYAQGAVLYTIFASLLMHHDFPDEEEYGQSDILIVGFNIAIFVALVGRALWNADERGVEEDEAGPASSTTTAADDFEGIHLPTAVVRSGGRGRGRERVRLGAPAGPVAAAAEGTGTSMRQVAMANRVARSLSPRRGGGIRAAVPTTGDLEQPQQRARRIDNNTSNGVQKAPSPATSTSVQANATIEASTSVQANVTIKVAAEHFVAGDYKGKKNRHSQDVLIRALANNISSVDQAENTAIVDVRDSTYKRHTPGPRLWGVEVDFVLNITRLSTAEAADPSRIRRAVADELEAAVRTGALQASIRAEAEVGSPLAEVTVVAGHVKIT